MATDVLDLELLGRTTVATEGRIRYIRDLFHLSRNRFAAFAGTSGKTVAIWETDTASSLRMTARTAKRLGELYAWMEGVLAALDHEGVDPRDLLPLADVAVRMGLGPQSKMLYEKCRTGVITCKDFGVLGFYIPAGEAEDLYQGVI